MPTRLLQERLRHAGLFCLLVVAAAGAVSATTGPDVTVINLTDVGNYGSSGGIIGYSVGTTSCNVGSVPVAWCNNAGGCGTLTDEEHPVIAQNLFRLKSGRFEQIGMSWLKHGFVSTNSFSAACGSCVSPPLGGDQLGVGCIDTYGSGLNGSRPLGMRSEVDATTGVFPYPYTQVGAGPVYEQRVKVLETDVDTDLNPGARFWVEGQYVTQDDAHANNAFNNASYREVTSQAALPYDLTFTGGTVREKSAIWAWQAVDGAVEIANVDFDTGPSGLLERFEVARKVTGGGSAWHYEYAIRNMNSDRSAASFTVTFPAGATISNAGFHDIDQHSGEPYATTDWTIDTSVPGTVSWSTPDATVEPNGNALRWATMFSFWFDSDQGPTGIEHRLGLFETGCPTAVAFFVPGYTLFADDFECSSFGAWTALSPP